MLKVALCCISKNEDLYLKDFIEYYKSIGFCNIIFGDNNDINNNSQRDILKPYIDSGFVKYENVQGKKGWQCKFYEDMYKKYRTQFSHIAFYDIDEYLCFADDNIKTINELLEKPEFIKADFIKFNWKTMTDNNRLYYEKKPVIKRFDKFNPNVWENIHIKSIAKCKTNMEIIWIGNPHVCKYKNGNDITVNAKGEIIKEYSPFVQPPIYENAYIKHFWSLSVEEFVKRRYKRGSADHLNSISKERLFDLFFKINEPTENKKQIFNDICNKIDNIKY